MSTFDMKILRWGRVEQYLGEMAHAYVVCLTKCTLIICIHVTDSLKFRSEQISSLKSILEKCRRAPRLPRTG